MLPSLSGLRSMKSNACFSRNRSNSSQLGESSPKYRGYRRPQCDFRHRNQWQCRVSPTFSLHPAFNRPTSNIRYLPVMISRIMLSLRKAADSQPAGDWSLGVQTTTEVDFRGMEFFRPWGGSNGREDCIPLDTYLGSKIEVRQKVDC